MQIWWAYQHLNLKPKMLVDDRIRHRWWSELTRIASREPRKISQSPDPSTQAAHHNSLCFNPAHKSEQPLKIWQKSGGIPAFCVAGAAFVVSERK
jgi:hypothetical protein